MNKLQVLGLCVAAVLIPMVLVVAANGDKFVVTDLSAGKMLYFAGSG